MRRTAERITVRQTLVLSVNLLIFQVSLAYVIVLLYLNALCCGSDADA
jgi:hypothetical protein